MSGTFFASSLVVGAALLALWIDARRPRNGVAIHAAMGHVVVAFLLLSVLPSDPGSTAIAATVIFGVVLPALIYAFLAAIWVIRAAQTALGSSYR